jgi:AcrR family transcriptional regulator
MPRAGLSESEIAEFRTRLTEVALRLFAEQGYEGVTLRALAAELGVSPMTPYRYFADKDEIIQSVRQLAYDRMADAGEAAVRGIADPRERLLALGRGIVAFALAEPHAYRHMFELNQPDAPPPIGSVNPAGRGWAAIMETVRDAVEAGVLTGDPLTVAHLMWAGVHGLVTLHLAHKLVIGRTIEDLLEPLLEGLLRAHAPPVANA